jgi:hypothetical protein
MGVPRSVKKGWGASTSTRTTLCAQLAGPAFAAADIGAYLSNPVCGFHRRGAPHE